MRAEIKFLHSTFVLDNLENYSPPDEDVFSIPLTMGVGPKGDAGEDNFDIEVVSPGWLAKEIKEGDILWLRHRLLMKKFDFRRVRQFLEGYVDGIEASTWKEIAEKLARLGHWEFEDYKSADNQHQQTRTV